MLFKLLLQFIWVGYVFLYYNPLIYNLQFLWVDFRKVDLAVLKGRSWIIVLPRSQVAERMMPSNAKSDQDSR